MSIDPANERKEAAMAAPDTSMRTAPADPSVAENSAASPYASGIGGQPASAAPPVAESGAEKLDASVVARRQSHRSLLFVAGLLVIAIAAWGCMQIAFAANADDRIAVITDSEGATQRIPLSENGSYPVETALGTNVVAVENGEVHMDSADCPGHDCINQGAIGSAGEIIVCLPHKLIVSIEGGTDEGASTIDTVAS